MGEERNLPGRIPGEIGVGTEIEDFDSWISPAVALRELGVAFRSTDLAVSWLLARLRTGKIASAAETALYRSPGTKTVEQTNCSIGANLYAVFFQPEWDAVFWQTGDALVEIEYSGLELMIDLVDVRFNPTKIRQHAAAHRAAMTPQRRSPDPSIAPLAAPSPNSRGGRPRAAFWDDLWIEMVRRIKAGRLNPKSAAQLETLMDDWLREKGFSPGESTLKPTALKLFKYLNENGG